MSVLPVCAARAWLRLASTLLAVEMMLILLCGGVDAVLFRNIGILGAALSLLISSYQDTVDEH